MPDIFAHTGDAIMRVDNEATWALARNASGAETISTTAARFAASARAAANSSGNEYDCYRYFAAFDTSGISVKPESAKLKLYGFLFTSAQIVVVKVNAGATGGTSTDYVAADFNQTSSTAYSSEITSFTNGVYNEITLNDAALTDMVSLDEFKIAVIDHDYDFSNQTPPNGTSRRTGWFHADQVGTSADPVISYVEGSDSSFAISQSEAARMVGNNHIINRFRPDRINKQYNRNVDQVPFSTGVPGPRTIRGRTTPYAPSLGSKTKK